MTGWNGMRPPSGISVQLQVRHHHWNSNTPYYHTDLIVTCHMHVMDMNAFIFVSQLFHLKVRYQLCTWLAIKANIDYMNTPWKHIEGLSTGSRVTFSNTKWWSTNRKAQLPWRNGPLARYIKCGLRMHRECRECFPHHRGLAIPTCITASASRHVRHVRAVMHAATAN